MASKTRNNHNDNWEPRVAKLETSMTEPTVNKDKIWREENKEELKAYHKKYSEEHKDERKARDKIWRESSKGKEYNKIWREDHKNELVVSQKKYQEKHKEEIKSNHKKYQEEHKDYIKEIRKPYLEKNKDLIKNTHIKREYGITIKEFKFMLGKQEGRCAICGQPETMKRSGKLVSLAIDHGHTHGKVRGLLCANCNAGLGKFKDNVLLLNKASNYLEVNNSYVNS